MEEQSIEETRPDPKSEDLNVEKAADVIDSDDLAKPDDESCAVEVEVKETEQAVTEKDELRNMQNASENPEEEFEASVRGDKLRNTQNTPENPKEQFEASGRSDEMRNMQNAQDNPEEEFAALVRGDEQVGDEFEEWANSDVEIFQNKDDAEEPESHEGKDHRESTGALQFYHLCVCIYLT